MSREPNTASYVEVDKDYFEKRGLRRYAGVWSLWALGVGAVISGHFSGWNYGLATGGWGGMLAASVIMAVMYLCLVFCIAEMSAALPHTGASYSFARTAMGTWGGFISGLCENVEYVMTPAVICFFIGSYLGSILGSDMPPWVWWIGTYGVFLVLNILGVALSFRVTLIVTLTSLAILLVFCISALPYVDFGRWALNIAPDGSELTEGNGPWFPTGVSGVLATLPYAVWLFLAIEELPLASEECIDPQRDMPRGILLALATLVATAFMIVVLNPAVIGVGSYKLGVSGEPLLDGFRAIFGGAGATLLGVIALSGLVASFHAILFAQGRQIFSLSRAGYFPTPLSITHKTFQTPHVAMLSGSALGLAIMIIMWNVLGGKDAGALIGSVLLNMAVFGAMLSYIFRAVSFIILRWGHVNIARPYRSPFGIPGALVTIGISGLTLYFQIQDANFTKGVVWVIVWFAVALIYFALIGRHRLILSPEEVFALEHQGWAGSVEANAAEIPATLSSENGHPTPRVSASYLSATLVSLEPIQGLGKVATLPESPTQAHQSLSVASILYDDTLDQTESRIRIARSNHMGYPYNLAFATDRLQRFGGYLINNLGDPYVGSHYAAEVCVLERQAISWFERLWQCDGAGYWGSVSTSGTEGNLWALYLGREALPGAVLVHSDEAHYSIPKAGRILMMDTRTVQCSADGAISIAHLQELLRVLDGRPVVLALTCGTTMKGAHDDIQGAIAAMDEAGYDCERRFIHVDGALNAMVVPFAASVPQAIRPSFRMAIDSLSTSGHKMVGTPMPCGVLISRRRHVDRIASAISYLRSNDTTLMGSRNGHAVLAIWDRVTRHGVSGFKADVAACLSRTERLVAELRLMEVPVLRNPASLTVVFPAPCEEIAVKYQLACDKGHAHAIVMPNVDDELIDRFLDEYSRWWRVKDARIERNIWPLVCPALAPHCDT